VSKSLTDKIQAPDIMAVAGPEVGAKGGGRADMARAGGGTDPAGLPKAFEAARAVVMQRLTG